MTKQNAIETVTSYFEEIDTRALVLDLKTTKDAEADYEAAKYLFGDQDPESETLNNHEDLLEENSREVLLQMFQGLRQNNTSFFPPVSDLFLFYAKGFSVGYRSPFGWLYPISSGVTPMYLNTSNSAFP